MRLPLRFRRPGWSFVLLFGFAASRALSQDYETDFKNGLRARDHGSWKEAITYFKRAAEARPQEGTERIASAGVIGYPYLPHYYLGEAYANSGNCVAALEQLDESEKQGFVQKAGKLKDLQNLRANCQDRVARVVPSRPVAPALTPTAVAVLRVPPTPVAVVAIPTQLPRPSPTENAIAQQMTAALPPLPRDVNIRINGARKLLAETSRKPLPAEAAVPKANLVRLLRDAQKLPSAAPSEIKAFDERLKIAISSLASALKPKPPQTFDVVPPPLREGASAYFAGDYASAAQILAAAPDFPDRRAAAEAKLFRSAARYALYVIGGAKDSNLERSALQDASDCRRLDPQVSPSPRVFSPRFVEFFTASAETGPRPSR